MAVYTVHQPPLRKNEASPDPDRYVFVRDGFHFWGFVLAPVWMIWHGLWLVMVLYLSLTTLLEIGLRFAGAPAALRVSITILTAFLVGLEAATLRRWTLKRRGYRNVGVVVSDDVDSAERRFFASLADTNTRSAPARMPSGMPRMPSDSTPDVLGLFPRPDSSR